MERKLYKIIRIFFDVLVKTYKHLYKHNNTHTTHLQHSKQYKTIHMLNMIQNIEWRENSANQNNGKKTLQIKIKER